MRYAIAKSTSAELESTTSRETGLGSSVSVFSPSDGETVTPVRGADNIFRIDVEGTIDGTYNTEATLLLWIQPVNPPSDQPGWYLQRLPANGIKSVTGNRWRGICQIGNQQWPPQNDDIIDVAATLVPTDEALRLQAKQGPLTVVRLPGAVSEVVRLRMRLE